MTITVKDYYEQQATALTNLIDLIKLIGSVSGGKRTLEDIEQDMLALEKRCR